VHLIIRAAFSDAVHKGLVARNVALVAHAPRLRSIPKVEQHAWTAEQLQMFRRSAAGHRFFAAFWVIANTGMRRSELLGLRWTDVDFAKGTLSIRHDVRHTHATLLLKASVPVKVVNERPGHATPAFTIKTYQHVLPGMQAEAARTFERLVAASSTGRRREKPRRKTA